MTNETVIVISEVLKDYDEPSVIKRDSDSFNNFMFLSKDIRSLEKNLEEIQTIMGPMLNNLDIIDIKNANSQHSNGFEMRLIEGANRTTLKYQ